MPTQQKSIALISTAVSSLLLVACAPHQPATVEDHPPLVVADVGPPSAAELYAQRYPSASAQVTAGGKQRFVICEPSCPGATPKTPLSSLNAAVAKRVRQALLADQAQASATTHVDGDNPHDPGDR